MKYLLTVCVFMVSSFLMYSQENTGENRPERLEKLEMLKRTYIAERLNLTTGEAEKFWPLYNELEQKKRAIKKSIKENSERLNSAGISDKVLTEILESITLKRKEEADIDREFVKSCIPVLGAAKASKIIGMEEDFKKKLMDELRERREERGPAPRGRK